MWFTTAQHSEETTWSSLHYSLCIVTPQGNCQHGDREQGGKIKKKKKNVKSPNLQRALRVFLQSRFLLQDPNLPLLPRETITATQPEPEHKREREREKPAEPKLNSPSGWFAGEIQREKEALDI